MSSELIIDEAEKARAFWGRVDEVLRESDMKTFKVLCTEVELNYNSMANNRSLQKLPNLSAAAAMARRLNTSLDWLYFGDSRVNADSKKAVVRAIESNPRLLTVTQKLAASEKSVLFAIDILLEDRSGK